MVSDTDDDFATVPNSTVYYQDGAQLCTAAPPNTFCPKVFINKPTVGPTPIPLTVGASNLFAGDNLHDGNVNAGVGDSAHEVGHTTGYEHSRVLSSSTQDYGDCYDQMSYDTCGQPGFPGEAGPPDGVVNYDAINLEFHGWVPSKDVYNSADKPSAQTTVRLHALSDPNALLTSPYLDLHMPASLPIEDVSSNNVAPTFPPTCSGPGYNCATSQYYTIEYRQTYGFDQSLRQGCCGGNALPLPVGAVVSHLYAPDPKNPAGNISYLVNEYPYKINGGGPFFLPHSAALQPGDDFADPVEGTYIAVNGFNKSGFTATVTVGSFKLTPKLVYTGDTTGATSKTATFSAQLTVDGVPVPNQPVTFSLPGEGCGPVVTNASGHAVCQITNTLKTGSYPITASFAGDSVYNATSAGATFAV